MDVLIQILVCKCRYCYVVSFTNVITGLSLSTIQSNIQSCSLVVKIVTFRHRFYLSVISITPVMLNKFAGGPRAWGPVRWAANADLKRRHIT